MQKALIRLGYEYVSRRDGMKGMGFMNYGYVSLDDVTTGTTNGVAEAERLSRNLYERVAGAVELAGKDVLEVGCGRGGGAAHVLSELGAGTVTGVDFAEGSIRECRRRYSAPGLRFMKGDAENLPFGAESFDAVLNVESSHCYPDFERFLHEAARVLRPEGVFLFADMRLSEHEDRMRSSFDAAGLKIREEERITPNVLRALELDSERRAEIVRRCVPRPLQIFARDFAGVEDSQVRTALGGGILEYRRFVLAKD